MAYLTPSPSPLAYPLRSGWAGRSSAGPWWIAKMSFVWPVKLLVSAAREVTR